MRKILKFFDGCRGRIYRRVVPGNLMATAVCVWREYCSSAPPTETLIILIILIILISAARRVQQISAVIQNSGADLPPRYARQLDGNGGMRVA